MPPKYPCAVCQKAVRSNSLAAYCDLCGRWCHIRHDKNFSKEQYDSLNKEDESFHWTCPECASLAGTYFFS